MTKLVRLPFAGAGAAPPDDAFIERVAEYTGYQHVALDNPEMRELILPAQRADVEMHENHVPRPARERCGRRCHAG